MRWDFRELTSSSKMSYKPEVSHMFCDGQQLLSCSSEEFYYAITIFTIYHYYYHLLFTVYYYYYLLPKDK